MQRGLQIIKFKCPNVCAVDMPGEKYFIVNHDYFAWVDIHYLFEILFENNETRMQSRHLWIQKPKNCCETFKVHVSQELGHKEINSNNTQNICPDKFHLFWKKNLSNAGAVIFEVQTPSNQLLCENIS